jgi:protein TonB
VVVSEKIDSLVVSIDTTDKHDTSVITAELLSITNAHSDISSSDEQLNKIYVSTNFDYIREQVYKGLVYPPIAIENSWEGAVLVAFLVDNNGDIDSIRVLKSSGYRLLDQNAVSAVKHAAPYPRSTSKVEIKLPVIYKMEG